MVILLENWHVFKEYVERWPLAEVMYHVSECGKGKVRVRVVAGRYGVDLTLPEHDELLQQVLEFLKEKYAKKALEVVQDIETFLSR